MAALRLQAGRGVIEIGCQIAGGGEDTLPQLQTRRVRGKLLQAVKKVADIGANAGSGVGKLGLQRLQLAERSVELAVLLGRLIDLNLKDGISQALDFFQNDSGANADRSA